MHSPQLIFFYHFLLLRSPENWKSGLLLFNSQPFRRMMKVIWIDTHTAAFWINLTCFNLWSVLWLWDINFILYMACYTCSYIFRPAFLYLAISENISWPVMCPSCQFGLENLWLDVLGCLEFLVFLFQEHFYQCLYGRQSSAIALSQAGWYFTNFKKIGMGVLLGNYVRRARIISCGVVTCSWNIYAFTSALFPVWIQTKFFKFGFFTWKETVTFFALRLISIAISWMVGKHFFQTETE